MIQLLVTWLTKATTVQLPVKISIKLREKSCEVACFCPSLTEVGTSQQNVLKMPTPSQHKSILTGISPA